ncbi:DUF4139 domain-containing protein [Desulfomicrobium salsuginis]
MTRLLAIIALLFPALAWAAPTQVTLFPSSAQVEEVSAPSCTPADGGLSSCTLTLPGRADPATLRFSKLPGTASIADLTWKARHDPDQAALAPLLAKRDELTAQRDAAAAELEGVRGRLAFWKAQTEPGQQTVAALRELAAELGANLRDGTRQAQALEGNIADLNGKIARVEEEIAAAAGRQRTVWEVTALVSGNAPGEVAYSYTLADCGWTPLYRLEALPAAGKIDFSWQAKVWQRSGQDWKDARLFLATLQPEAQAEPSDLPPWEIRPMQIFQKTMAAPAMMEMRAGAADEMVAAAPAPPREIRRATYAAWDMGKKSLPAGAERIIDIERGSWPASFLHLMRPSLDAKAFVQARAEFKEPKELPPGTAFFLLDGAMVDQREFALSGREGTLFFGTDPLLTCETTLGDKKTGEKGLFGQKQSFVRQWTLTVRNAAARPVQVRIEEPRPLPRDERISVELTAKPEPLAEDDPEILAWNATVPAGGQSVIELGLKMTAPDDLHVDPGWRW